MKKLVWVSVWSIAPEKIKEIEVALEDKVGCKPTSKKGLLSLYHPHNLPNEMLLGKAVAVIKDTSSTKSVTNINEVYSLGPYNGQRKKGERSLLTEISYSEFIDDPAELFERKSRFTISFWLLQQDQEVRIQANVLRVSK